MQERNNPQAVPAMRAPETVMRLARMGCYHGSPLSFMRQLTRRAAAQAWTFRMARWDVDGSGVGRAVLEAQTGTRAYSLVAFFHDLPAEKRSDRVIAEAWDATFTLFDGVPSDADLTRLEANVPLQEAGRLSVSELSLSRANRSVRLWSQVVDALATGRQPDTADIGAVGYLMRTTAVYGSGKFGAADRALVADRPEASAPFQIEMLAVYLIRWAVLELVQHMARAKGGAQAVALDPAIARGLGIGNSTGLGMAPFLINHPVLIHNWVKARETAIARVRARAADPSEWRVVQGLVETMTQKVATWRTDHPRQAARDADLASDLGLVANWMTAQTPDWDALLIWAEGALTLEGQEWLASAILEPFATDFDDLCAQMCDDSGAARLNGSQSVGVLRGVLEQNYGWALSVDWDSPEATARAWYVSEEKLEPRLGERAEEPIEPYEQPLAPGRDAARLYSVLRDWDCEAPVASVAMAHPELRHILRRVQVTFEHPYAEVRDNTIDAAMMPIDLLRAKLAFFGAQRFDPRSDRWLRICMFAGAPLPTDLSTGSEALWPYWRAPWE